jgi:hypothetical protein
MTATLDAINAALQTLAAANCRRANGVWVDRDGRELASDPVGAARALRHQVIERVVREHQTHGQRPYFTR